MPPAVPLAVRYRCWRSLVWMPTWFAFAFLGQLAALEAIISLPTRPFAWRPPARGSSAEVPGKGRSVALRA